ncbi:hypothetical protein BU15DRAFT_50373 [Melanogaster broomeanus]|nr:hypothetical protein BU15DRAFT_50373 [Melanogaster broomeanus]
MQADTNQIQYELNMAALRSNVKLLDRLQQQSIDTDIPHDGGDLGHVVSRLFIKYSHVLLGALEICQSEHPVSVGICTFAHVTHHHRKCKLPKKEADVRDSVVTDLSHLVIANSENGVRHCILILI